MANLLDELKRRNVIRVALAYLAAAWLVAQFMATLGDLVTLPDWVGPALLVIVVAGFVVVVSLAWIYDLTGQGLKTDAELRADPALARIQARYLDYLIIGLLTIALGYFIWESRFGPRAPSQETPISIAVLPFADLSPDGGQEWFAIGMADDLMNALVRIPGLRVAGRRSASTFDPDRQNLAEFASAIGVSHVLEGSVRTDGSTIRISAQLVRAADGFNVWSQVFDAEATDVFDVQHRIAENVLNGLRLHIGVDSPVVPAQDTDFASYQAYLKGRYHLSRRTAPDLQQAVAFFEESIRLEPDRSRTHSGLAAVYAIMPYYAQSRSMARIDDLARTQAEAAIRLDDTNAEAHSILGMIHMTFSRDWARARSSFARAFELSAGDADILNLYGDYFYVVGDYVSAEKMEGAAAVLEPLSAVHQLELGLVYDFRGQYDRAIEQATLAITLNSDLQNAWWQLCRSYIHSGSTELAEQELRQNAERLGPRYAARVRALLAAERGDQTTLQSLAADEEQEFLQSGGSPTIVAFLFALAGDDTNAAAYVKRAIDSGDAILVSPMYFFLPEDWGNLDKLQQALAEPGLVELYDLRRRNIQSRTGRVLT